MEAQAPRGLPPSQATPGKVTALRKTFVPVIQAQRSSRLLRLVSIFRLQDKDQMNR